MAPEGTPDRVVDIDQTGTPDRVVDVDDPTSYVSSFNGRSGGVAPQQSDYDSFFTTPAEAATAAPVQSVFGRTGAVTALAADYDGFFLTPAEGDAAYLAKPALTDGSVLFAASGQVAQDNPNLFYDNATDLLIVGPRGTGTFEARITAVETGSGARRGLASLQASADTNGARIIGRKSRGTPSAPAVVVTGDTLANFAGFGYDGANWLEMANIRQVAEGSIAATAIPTRLEFHTATNATPSVLTERLRLLSDGTLIVGTAVGTISLNPGGLTVYAAAGAQAAIFRVDSASPGATGIQVQNSTASQIAGLSSTQLLFTSGTAPIIGTSDNNHLDIRTNGATVWRFSSSSNLVPVGTTNTQDIGNASNRVKSIFAGTSLVLHDGTNPLVTVDTNGVTLAAGKNIVLATATGTKIGTGTTQLLAFHNSAPVAQRAGAAQDAVVTTGAALTSYGYTETQANAIVTLVNEIRAALVEKGLIKGAA